jgi:DNA polymerase elongation subunit (family B)
MTKYYFIKCEYRVEEDFPIIYLWGRNLETYEKVLFRVCGFEPYFYVLESEEVPKIPQIKKVISGFKSIFGEVCKKIIVGIPEDVKDLKSQFSKTFEGDIPFTRRFLINVGIRRYFIVQDGKLELNYTEIIGQ